MKSYFSNMKTKKEKKTRLNVMWRWKEKVKPYYWRSLRLTEDKCQKGMGESHRPHTPRIHGILLQENLIHSHSIHFPNTFETKTLVASVCTATGLVLSHSRSSRTVSNRRIRWSPSCHFFLDVLSCYGNARAYTHYNRVPIQNRIGPDGEMRTSTSDRLAESIEKI